MLLEYGALQGGRRGLDDVVFQRELGVECVVVEDWIAEVKDGGSGGAVAVCVVVVGSVGVFDVIRGIAGRTHVGENM